MRFIRFVLMGLVLIVSTRSFAQQTADWGVVPLDQDTTISFARYDITNNFTDQYAFSLQGTGDAAYAVTVTFDFCRNGCGSPDVTYGVYDANGSLINNTGSVVLTAGNYVFQVKGTGMGSGSSVDYSGSMSFFASAAPMNYSTNYFVSAVPEPGDYLLMLAGLACLGWALTRRRRSHAHGAARTGWGGSMAGAAA